MKYEELSEEDKFLINEEHNHCQNCGKPLDRKNDEYHRTWGTCDMYCYADLVGVNLHEF